MRYLFRYILPACCLIAITSLLNGYCVFAQSVIPYQQFTSENGLSENVVYCILKDTKGFIWIGTDYGLNRFDGYGFRQYNQVNTDSSSLSNSSILCIWEDGFGKFWIGTYGGLNYLDPESGHVERIHIPGHGLNYRVSDFYNLGNGNLFLIINPTSAFLFHIANRTFTPLPLDKPATFINDRIFRFRGNQPGLLLAQSNSRTSIALLNKESRSLEIKTMQEMFPKAIETSLEYYFNDSHGNHFLSTYLE